MDDPLGVTVSHALQDLPNIALYQPGCQVLTFLELTHVLVKVDPAVLLDEVDVTLCHDGVFELDNVGVVKLGQNGDFADSCRRDPIVAIVDVCLLYREFLPSQLVSAVIDVPVCTLT